MLTLCEASTPKESNEMVAVADSATAGASTDSIVNVNCTDLTTVAEALIAANASAIAFSVASLLSAAAATSAIPPVSPFLALTIALAAKSWGTYKQL